MTAPRPQNEDSLREFLERVRPRLVRVLKRFRVPPADADDLLQQTFLALLYRIESVDDPERWLIGVMRKKCLMYWRSERRRLDEPMDLEQLEWLAVPSAPAQEAQDLSRDLSALVGRLPARYRSLVRLRFGLGLDTQEVALVLGYRPSSIGKILSRCLASLSEQARTAGFCPRECHSEDEREDSAAPSGSK